MTSTSLQSELVDRVHAALRGREVREVRMFGGLSFMVDGALAVAVGRDGTLLVRVDPHRDADLLSRPNAARAEMGTGRTMGVGWIRVSGAGVADQVDLEVWIAEALSYLAQRRAAPS